LNLSSNGIKYLADLKPVATAQEFADRERSLRYGIKGDGLVYRGEQPAKPDVTYVLRSIAYRGELIRSIDGLQYNELDYDKRRDVIVAFRIVDRDAAGNLTIIWRTLRDTESPRLKVN
jgi:hypothetical protein